MVTFFTVSYDGVTPYIFAFVLALQYTTCFDPDMSGAIFATPLIFQIRSECSIRNTFLFPPLIALTFPEFFAPGDIVRRLVPSELIFQRILSVAHCPIARRTTTENTPIIIPSEESQALILLASIFFTAVFAVWIRFIVCDKWFYSRQEKIRMAISISIINLPSINLLFTTLQYFHQIILQFVSLWLLLMDHG